MFAVAFPLAPLCALLNNVAEIRVDAFKLCKSSQRPAHEVRSSIGTWYYALEGMAVLSVLTNCAILGLTSRQVFDSFHLSIYLFIFIFLKKKLS